jgi:signal transduction histidine kinase
VLQRIHGSALAELTEAQLVNLSHELRTPLNGIIGFSELLVDEKPGPLNAKQKEYLGDILNSGRHLLERIDDVLERSKGETGRFELDASSAQLEMFFFSMSHDLRAPLRHITGFAELLEQHAGATLDEDSRAFLTHILASARRMDKLIDALLHLARTTRAELSVVDVDMEAVLDEALSAVHADTRGRNIQWQRTCLPVVRADPVLIRQVLVNLLSNAVKYTRTRDPAVIEVGTRPGRADEVVIFVRDNGVGFDLRQASGLFGAFRRLHRAEEFEGIGVGLANAHRIVTRHGGSIWAEAAVGAGATFFFSVPEHGQNTGRR